MWGDVGVVKWYTRAFQVRMEQSVRVQVPSPTINMAITFVIALFILTVEGRRTLSNEV